MQSLDLLRDLIAFPTVSDKPNRELILYCADLLDSAGADVRIIEGEAQGKANLFASIGSGGRGGGALLSGHTDVVPVEGQDWTRPPFEAVLSDGKLYGRGAADMKGFVACALSAALKAARKNLKAPLHLALSHDEEVGCVGVRSMIEALEAEGFRARFCIVGEPTSMKVAARHKGKIAFEAVCKGREAHSALPRTGLNAIHMACDAIAALRVIQEEIEAKDSEADSADSDSDGTTIHVGKIEGGSALNIVPNRASFLFEIRNRERDDPQAIIDSFRERIDEMLEPLRSRFPNAEIALERIIDYPALETAEDSEVVGFAQSLTESKEAISLAYGCEAGLFSSRLGIPTVVCGPGSMAQGHKPDEFVSLDQLAECDAMLNRLLERLEAGIPEESVSYSSPGTP